MNKYTRDELVRKNGRDYIFTPHNQNGEMIRIYHLYRLSKTEKDLLMNGRKDEFYKRLDEKTKRSKKRRSRRRSKKRSKKR